MGARNSVSKIFFPAFIAQNKTAGTNRFIPAGLNPGGDNAANFFGFSV
jgi:hypothetical protein